MCNLYVVCKVLTNNIIVIVSSGPQQQFLLNNNLVYRIKKYIVLGK